MEIVVFIAGIIVGVLVSTSINLPATARIMDRKKRRADKLKAEAKARSKPIERRNGI